MDDEDRAEDRPIHIGFWGEPELVDRIQAVADRLSQEWGVAVSRSAALRKLVVIGLEELEDM